MPRIARIVVPGLPHHVAQCGNRREPIFFEDGDQSVYFDLLAEQMRKCGVEVWAYCLMPNHVHLVLMPKDDAGLSRAIGIAHRRYTHFINARGRWTLSRTSSSAAAAFGFSRSTMSARANALPPSPTRRCRA
jgi:putative transposase